MSPQMEPSPTGEPAWNTTCDTVSSSLSSSQSPRRPWMPNWIPSPAMVNEYTKKNRLQARSQLWKINCSYLKCEAPKYKLLERSPSSCVTTQPENRSHCLPHGFRSYLSQTNGIQMSRSPEINWATDLNQMGNALKSSWSGHPASLMAPWRSFNTVTHPLVI